jgi:hypothetical protein
MRDYYKDLESKFVVGCIYNIKATNKIIRITDINDYGIFYDLIFGDLAPGDEYVLWFHEMSTAERIY